MIFTHPSLFIRAPPCCAVGRFISRHVRVTGEAGSRRRLRVAGSHGPAKPAFCRNRPGKLVIIIISGIVTRTVTGHSTLFHIQSSYINSQVTVSQEIFTYGSKLSYSIEHKPSVLAHPSRPPAQLSVVSHRAVSLGHFYSISLLMTLLTCLTLTPVPRNSLPTI